jgi:hypothetical protein
MINQDDSSQPFTAICIKLKINNPDNNQIVNFFRENFLFFSKYKIGNPADTTAQIINFQFAQDQNILL